MKVGSRARGLDAVRARAGVAVRLGLRAAVIGVLAVALSNAGAAASSRLALPLIGSGGPGADPRIVFAQRVIDRSWGPAEDSIYVESEIPQWRSEGWSMAFSAAVPGAGQAYVGERSRALGFVALEAAGWISRVVFRHRGEELRAAAAAYVGSPEDSSSTWSFDRWAATTHGDPAELRALWNADRASFYDLIGSDSRFLPGWAGNPEATRETFSEYLGHADDRLRNARYASTALWVNHLVAAIDALRAARLNDVPLRRNLDLKLKSGWRHGRPEMFMALERRF